MNRFPENLYKKLEKRKEEKSIRVLGSESDLVDFSSNDYLGYARSRNILERTQELICNHILKNGATGSRLLTGNHSLYNATENLLTQFYATEAALIYNSGYDANLGFFSSVPARGDLLLYDEFIHASIRDGISLGRAKAFKFKHNDLEDLGRQLDKLSQAGTSNNIFVVTESVFSMDGDSPDLRALVELTKKTGTFLIVDEAHALGVIGERGKGLVQELDLQQHVFARIMTFGKGLGAHGAAILGSRYLKDYLVNFSRSLIYTTALPPHAVATIFAAHESLSTAPGSPRNEIQILGKNIDFFKLKINHYGIRESFIVSNSAIQSCVVPGNLKVKFIAEQLQNKGFNVKPILSPTVPEGMERLRFCLHSYNTEEEIAGVLENLSSFLLGR